MFMADDYVDPDLEDAAVSLDSNSSANIIIDTMSSSGSSSQSDEEELDVASVKQTFDATLPVMHSYLGTDLLLLQGRTLLDEGSVLWLPVLPQSDVVLMPGQTLPLSVYYPPTIRMLRRCIESNRLFGAICMEPSPTSNSVLLADIGTTAEIYESQMTDDDDDEGSVRVKAVGRQRFKVLGIKQESEGFTSAQVEVLPEIILPSPMAEICLNGLDRFRTQELKSDIGKKKMSHIRRYDSITSVWPAWVYAQYDAKVLVQRMLHELSLLKTGAIIPTDPVELSFWVARSLPIRDKTRLMLLRMNCAIQRLQWELGTLHKINVLCCRYCNSHIAHQRDVFSMSAEGLQGAYCNEYGYVYETITIYKANGLRLQGDKPSTDFSWFPGYGWTIAACSRCQKHMGWLFTAVSPDLKPDRFWGLCRRSLSAKLQNKNELKGL